MLVFGRVLKETQKWCFFFFLGFEVDSPPEKLIIQAGLCLSWRIIPGLGYVVNNHGDRKSPNWGCGTPYLQMAFLWLINGGDPNHVLTGVILQVSWHSQQQPRETDVNSAASACPS